MRRPGRGSAEDALELFLDAISNAFGAVIFIALLVCVLLQLSGKAVRQPPAPPTEDYVDWLKSRLRKAKSDAEELESWRGRWIAEIETRVKARRPDLTEEYVKQTAERARKEGEYARLQAEERTVRQEIEEHRSAVQEFEAKKGELEQHLARIIAALEDLAKRSAHRIRLPEARETDKKAVAILLAEGRAALVNRYDTRGEVRGLNATEVEQGPIITVPGSGGEVKMTSYRKRPGKGVRIDADLGFRTALREQLRMFKPTSHYLVLAVWGDSFAEFERLRDWLTDEMHYDYGLQLLSKDEWIKAGTKAGKTLIQ